MIYIFTDGKCITTASSAVDTDDLATRNEIAVESNDNYDISKIEFIDGKISVIDASENGTQQILPNAAVNEDTLALAEAVLELSAEIDKLKGGAAQ